MDEPHKKTAKRRFLSARTCAVKHLCRCVLARCSVSRRPRPPLIICQVSKKKKKKKEDLSCTAWLSTSDPRRLVWNRRADKQIKCGTAGEDRRESFKQISAHVEARGCVCVCRGGAPEPFSCPRTPKKETHTLLLEGFFFFPAWTTPCEFVSLPVCVCVCLDFIFHLSN